VSTPEVVGVVLLGTLVGLDLASVPQAMISRPVVAAFLGGLVVGNALPGLVLGAVLELFALETLPVGAARYPDWGPGAVAAGALAGSQPGAMLASALLGLALVAVASAWAGGWCLHLVRRANAGAVAARRAALDAGDAHALRALQRAGLGRDAVRSGGLTAVSLALGAGVSTLFATRWSGPQIVAQVALASTSVGVALVAGWRLAGTGRQALWFVGGLSAGALATVVWLR
jgi:PTS system mannose-specific IIC component